MVNHIADELTGDEAELLLLSKGLAYQLGNATLDVLPSGLPLNLVATRRAKVGPADAYVEVPYSRIDFPARRLLIGDTVASGASLIAAFEEYRKLSRLEHVYVISYAGSGEGAERIRRYCVDAGIEVTFLFGLAAFGLGANGFDLSFLHPDTVTSDYCKDRAHEQFGMSPISAVGWDFGSQWMSPLKYRWLCWVEAEVWGIHGHPSLALEERPRDFRLLAAELDAFRHIFDTFESTLPRT